jgi:hypothetical protein
MDANLLPHRPRRASFQSISDYAWRCAVPAGWRDVSDSGLIFWRWNASKAADQLLVIALMTYAAQRKREQVFPERKHDTFSGR